MISLPEIFPSFRAAERAALDYAEQHAPYSPIRVAVRFRSTYKGGSVVATVAIDAYCSTGSPGRTELADYMAIVS